MSFGRRQEPRVHQPATYLLTDWRLTGKQVETTGAGRFRLEPGEHDVVDDWSWYENPFVRGMGQGSRNDVEGFEEQSLIKSVEGQEITFDYRGIHNGLVDTLTVDDVVWTCRLMARISDRQWDGAFRAAGYSDAERQRFIAKLKSKIDEGLALRGAKPLG